MTQTALGFSRDDIEATVLPLYVDEHIVDRSPFATIDERGVGELVQMAVERGRNTRPGLETGVCGGRASTKAPGTAQLPQLQGRCSAYCQFGANASSRRRP